MDWTIGPLDLGLFFGPFFGLFFGPFLGLNFVLFFFKGWVGSFVRGVVYQMFFLREGEVGVYRQLFLKIQLWLNFLKQG